MPPDIPAWREIPGVQWILSLLYTAILFLDSLVFGFVIVLFGWLPFPRLYGFARAWAAPFEPWEEVCLAAEQHDIAWTNWERVPDLDPETGLPYTFSALPRLRRLELWSGAATLLLPQSRYAALLVSMHGTLLVERFPPGGDEDVERALAEYLERERGFQARVLESLRGDPRYGAQPGSASFCNADDDLLPGADLWIHGHLHCRHDYRVLHPAGAPRASTRVVSNARGHGFKGEADHYDGAFTVEV